MEKYLIDSEQSRKNAFRITVMLYIIMYLYAVFTTLTGTQLLILMDEFQLRLEAGGIFSVVVNGGCIFGILISAFFLESYDKRFLVLVSYFVFSILLVLIKFTSAYLSFLLLLLGAGLSMKFLDASINAAVSNLHPEKKGFYMNLLHCSFGIGAFTGPIVNTLLMNLGMGWREVYLTLGIACLITGFLYMAIIYKCKINKTVKTVNKNRISVKMILNPKVFCLMAILLFYCGHQAGINSWIPSYMQETLHMPAIVANMSLSAFWIGLICGRLISAVLTNYMAPEKILSRGILLGAIFLLGGIVSKSVVLTFVGVTGAGIFAGATIPLVLTIGYGWFPEHLGVINTVLFLCIAGGATIFPGVMGYCSKFGGLYTALIVDAVCLVFTMLTACVILPWYSRGGRD